MKSEEVWVLRTDYNLYHTVGTGLAPVLICYASNCGQPQGLSLRVVCYLIGRAGFAPAVVCKVKIMHKQRIPLTRELSFFIRKMTEGEITKI